jgi:hypothetical protein
MQLSDEARGFLGCENALHQQQLAFEGKTLVVKDLHSSG